ncbi:MAG: hypothetical protein AB7O24_23170 [Kofleriaceae bacterium]
MFTLIIACAADGGQQVAGDHDGCEGAKCDDGTLPACPAINGLIGGGTAAPGQLPATAGLLVAPSGGPPTYLTCTMTKVGPRVFVTAAHCMFPHGEQDGSATVRPEVTLGAEIGILFGVYQPSDPLPGGHPASVVTTARVVDQRIHPTWFERIATEIVDGRLLATDADVALLIVDVDTPDIATATFDLDGVDRCAPLVMNGYGCDFFGAGATTTELRFLDAQLEQTVGSLHYISSSFTAAANNGGICPGDSGGALFAAEPADNLTIVGINSRFLSGQLLGSQLEPNQSYFTRLDDDGPQQVATWLRDQLSELGISPSE